ncbi:hypothetical protein MBEHAL_0252 [Halarchaeum acidiphilum MH1-52-1]|uniref:Uncharacterized protein n=1 Tax=Halarchaeum acidiphilum MH1-52-1 TaxID=1261545 RepID=U2YRY2_9EURY|nr:hypothetical protein MBEHAL_0252 [Halarchaeum acidiphilum MH1-52-1]
MSAFETYECPTRGSEFKACEDANAAETGYCSPACQTGR